MKITFHQLRKIALELSSETPMQPYYDENRMPSPREAVLWFIAYAEAQITGDGKPRCFVCGETFLSYPALKDHYVKSHLPKPAKEGSNGEATPAPAEK